MIETSIGTVTGEFWSDRLVGIALTTPGGQSLGDSDATVNDDAELGELLAEVGVPREEAQRLAAAFWEREIAPLWEEWTRREAERDKRENRLGFILRSAARFIRPS